MMKLIIPLSFVLLFASCGADSEEVKLAAIEKANTYLTNRNCDKAISVLNEIGMQTTNSSYLVTLASAYACKASYSSTTFFGSDVTKTSSDNSFLGGLTLYSTSSQTITAPFYTDEKVDYIQTAIDTLLYSGGAISSDREPTAARRTAIHGSNVGDIDSFASYLILVQLGKFLKYYGDGSGDPPVKGAGSATNTCLTDYSNAPAAIQTGITTAGETGSCTTTNGGHSELGASVNAVLRKQRLCQGIILFNNLFDLLPSILASATGTDLSTMTTIQTAITDARTALTTAVPGIGNVLTVQSQENCENDTTITTAYLESFYAVMLETSFK